MQTLAAPPPARQHTEIRFDEAAPRLADLFGPVLALVVQLRSSDQYGDAQQLRQQIRDLLDEAETRAHAAGVPPEDVRDAGFALVAFIDEAILSSDWFDKDSWLSRPLQLERFERFDAGEVFFDRVQELLTQPHRAEVLEIYYLCMTLGFKGQYQIRGQDELRQLIASAYAALQRAPGLAPSPLAPRGTPGAAVVAEEGTRLSPWAIAAAAAAVALLVYLGMSLYVSSAARSTVEVLGALTQ